MNELAEKEVSNDMTKTSEPSPDYPVKAESRYELSDGRGNSAVPVSAYNSGNDVGGTSYNSSNVVNETETIGSTNIRDVKIVPLNSGYLVKVGCQSLAVERTETLLTRLNDYLTNPYEFEKKWFSNDNRNKLDNF